VQQVRRASRVQRRVGTDSMAGWTLVVGLGVGWWRAVARVAMISDRSEDRPLHAERIRR